MRCKTVIERLDDHVDGLLPVGEAETISEHLDDCAECRETAMAAKFASSTLAAWDDVEPPQDGYSKVLARLEALPLEAFERPAAPAPRKAARLLRMPSMDVHRFRRVATGGLAAAAAVLGVMVATKTTSDNRPLRRVQPWTNNVAAATQASWFQGYQFDPGLLYHRSGRATLRPFGVEPSLDEQLVGSPR